MANTTNKLPRKKSPRKDLRGCELCGRRFRIMLKGQKRGGKRRKPETEDVARARHRRDPVCQAIAVERFAEKTGWLRIGNGSHVRALRSAGIEVVYLPCNITDEPYTGAQVNSYTAFAAAAAVEAVQALSRTRLSSKERADVLRKLVDGDPAAVRAIHAAKRLGGVAAAKQVAKEALRGDDVPD